MIEVEDLDDVGKTLDRAASHQITVACTIGRHSNDEMTSIYIETPSGFLVEYGWGGLLIGDNHEISSFAQSNIWGHDWQESWLTRWRQEQSSRD